MKKLLTIFLCATAIQFEIFAQYGGQRRLGGGQEPDYAAAQALAEVQAADEAAKIQEEHNAFVPRDPWRAIYGTTNYIKTSGVEFCGKVLEVQPTGIRIQGNYGTLFQTSYSPSLSDDYNTEFFVANFPFEAAENDFIPETHHWMAFYVGTYTYSTVAGGSRTIRKLDYGTPCGVPPELIKQEMEIQRQQATLQ